MPEMQKINEAVLDHITGGVTKTVKNSSAGYANIRRAPGLRSDIFLTVKNGEEVSLTGNRVKRDGYVWSEIYLAVAYDYGWIAGSLIGY